MTHTRNREIAASLMIRATEGMYWREQTCVALLPLHTGGYVSSRGLEFRLFLTLTRPVTADC